jgi:hypothetical protein
MFSCLTLAQEKAIDCVNVLTYVLFVCHMITFQCSTDVKEDDWQYKKIDVSLERCRACDNEHRTMIDE